MRIATRKIGPNNPPFIIAEVSTSHNDDINRALKIMGGQAKYDLTKGTPLSWHILAKKN
jgi:sialic acid synthase SpsE